MKKCVFNYNSSALIPIERIEYFEAVQYEAFGCFVIMAHTSNCGHILRRFKTIEEAKIGLMEVIKDIRNERQR